MAKCSKCGKDSMTFTCKYCGEKFCSEHRLPENHGCEDMQEEVEKEKEETGKWFQEKEVREDLKPPSVQQPRKPSLLGDMWQTLKNNATLAIIAVTVLSFMLQSVPGYRQLLMLEPAAGQLIAKPWSIATVMLVHGGLFHIFANMITFYFFGNPLERVVGARKLLKFYIGSGIAASTGFILFSQLLYALHGPTIAGIPTLRPAVGASGAVIAVFAAVAMLYPEAEVLLYFFIPMKIKTALYAFAGIEAIGIAAKTSGIILPVLGSFASSAHLVGLLIGVWYGKKLRQKYSTKAGVLDLLGY